MCFFFQYFPKTRLVRVKSKNKVSCIKIMHTQTINLIDPNKLYFAEVDFRIPRSFLRQAQNTVRTAVSKNTCLNQKPWLVVHSTRKTVFKITPIDKVSKWLKSKWGNKYDFVRKWISVQFLYKSQHPHFFSGVFSQI